MINPSIIQKALLEISAGASIYATAKKYSIPRTTLQQVAKSKGVESEFQRLQGSIKAPKEEILALRQTGIPLSKIAEKTGYSATTVAKWCKGNAVVLSNQQVSKNLSRAKSSLQELAVQYRLEGMFITEIAKKLQCAKSSVSLWLKNSNADFSLANEKVQERKRKTERPKQLRRPKVLKMGKAPQPAKISHFLTEKELLENVVHDRFCGLSFPEIGEKYGMDRARAGNVCRKHSFTTEERQLITKLVEKRTLARRHAGELKPVGGLRLGCERSKFGYYRGIYCSSTYELCWVIYQLDHGKSVQRFPSFLEDKKLRFKYYPDFLESKNHIIEIKGYEDVDFVKKKTMLAESMGYRVTILRKDDLEHMFEYVDEKYGVKKNTRHTLYDDHKPKHTLVCINCQKTFTRETLRGSQKNRCCGQSCAGQYRAQINRSQKGGQLKLSDQQARKIFVSQESHVSLAKKYGVNRSLISLIKSKKSYSWIHGNS